MRKLVVIDLSAADIDKFESYERAVLPLLSKYQGRLELSVRSIDGATETHVLHFPNAASFEEFIADPVRASLKDDWLQTGVTSSISDVEHIDYL